MGTTLYINDYFYFNFPYMENVKLKWEVEMLKGKTKNNIVYVLTFITIDLLL